MLITVLFFGAVADEVGVRMRDFSFTAEPCIADIFERMKYEYPSLKRHKLLISLNQEYVSGDQRVNDGDEIAIFTAVSGG